jgi:hypothetical protein
MNRLLSQVAGAAVVQEDGDVQARISPRARTLEHANGVINK